MTVQFETKNLFFRTLQESDQGLYKTLYTDPATMKYIAEPLTEQAVGSMFKAQLKPWRFKSKRFWNLVVSHKPSNQIIGLCGVITQKIMSRQGEVGVMLLPKHVSKGFGTEILGGLTQYCFEELNYNKIWGPPFPANTGSIRIMQKVGFIKEATLRQHHFLNGEFHDAPFYTLLNDEFKAGYLV